MPTFRERVRTIQGRKKPNDVFITPLALAKTCILYHDVNPTDVWYDPFKNSGSFYNQYPTDNKVYSEILEKKDFFDYTSKVDIISSNPPYSILGKVLEHTMEICNKEFGYLVGAMNLTPRRIERCNKKGFFLKSMFIVRVDKWFGYSFYVVFSKEINTNIIQFHGDAYKLDP